MTNPDYASAPLASVIAPPRTAMRRKLQISDLPPYGFINADWMKDARGVPPPDARPGGPNASVEDYPTWFASLVDDLSDRLWPRYDRSTGTWEGKARDTAMDLTLLDMQLMRRLRDQLDTPINRKVGTIESGPTHRHFFEEEDLDLIDRVAKPADFLRPGASFREYDTNLSVNGAQAIYLDFAHEGWSATGDVDLQLKFELQRPRAWQVAFMAGLPDIQYQFAHTAVTPSMVSGHALQSTIAACHTYLDKMQGGPADLIDAWAQFAVDVGDRRVFAGVHYPSDNLASWITALRLAPLAFGTERALRACDFLCHAIREKSQVYAAIAAAAGPKDSPYHLPLEWLHEEMLSASPRT